MERKDVYKAIDSEREYQDKLWDNFNKEINNPSSFILWMERYLHIARELASTKDERVGTEGNHEIMDTLRKVVGLGVACMEINGVPNRPDINYDNKLIDTLKEGEWLFNTETEESNRVSKILDDKILFTYKFKDGQDEISVSDFKHIKFRYANIAEIGERKK